MSVRQYIGARYVTKVYENSLDPSSAEWESGRAYEPLILVTYNNSSYMSKKQVPANVGNPASNSAYWVCTGYYNGQIIQLQNDISDIQADITSLQATIKKKYIFGGDSYSIENFGHTGWIDLVNSNMDLTRGVDSFDARDAVGYYGGSFGAGTFLTQLQALYENVVPDPDEITHICYFAGANEGAQTTTDTKNGMRDFCDYARAHFPNAKIIIGFIGNLTTTTKTDLNDLYRALDLYRKCGDYGAAYCSNIEYVNFHLRDYYDGIHPNDYTTIAAAIASGIQNGSVDFVKGGATYNNNNVSIAFNVYNGTGEAEISIAQTGLSSFSVGVGYNSGQSEIADFGIRVEELQAPLIGYVKGVYGSPGAFYTADFVIQINTNGKVLISVANYNGNNGTALSINGNLLIQRQKLVFKQMKHLESWE